jgi:hypothetical protein
MDIMNSSIEEMLKVCGVKIIQHNSLSYGVALPKKTNLYNVNETSYEDWDDETKLNKISEYISKENHFLPINWEFFFPNLNFNKLEEDSMISLFQSIRIFHINYKFKMIFRNLPLRFLKYLLNNKDFIKCFSKEFQMKVILLPIERLYGDFEKEIEKIIEDKIIELGIEQKLEMDLPIIIMKNLDKLLIKH